MEQGALAVVTYTESFALSVLSLIIGVPIALHMIVRFFLKAVTTWRR